MTKKNDKEKESMNSFMVRNEKELKEHSKVMEHVSSNENVKKSGKIPDPEQHETKTDKDDK
ncbi:hypothetical protein [Pseudalkalibacillus salsuginis]|uniref:hypothetical protein n=1 Tax=Pseudalkalibacillus salsuginis TaxID=2910972 RepID=UPI001CD6EEB8|nr:hypothetical protein [Pseudalkalibacillus salsuginis]MCF6410983.1 hypothetical protein [Pseudalkalibacillus salsuginis]